MDQNLIYILLVAGGAILGQVFDFIINNGQRKRDDFQQEFTRLQKRVDDLEKKNHELFLEIKGLNGEIAILKEENAKLRVENEYLRINLNLKKGEKQ